MTRKPVSRSAAVAALAGFPLALLRGKTQGWLLVGYTVLFAVVSVILYPGYATPRHQTPVYPTLSLTSGLALLLAWRHLPRFAAGALMAAILAVPAAAVAARAVEVTKQGESDPVLVTHWTMGRDKKNPKPMDHSSFATIVKTATEILLRHEQSARARLHKSISFTDGEGRAIRFDVDIVPDDDDPHAIAAAYDEATNELIRSGRVSPTFKPSAQTAARFIRSGE